jgi:ABC-2 type transport system ATP-binding protein
MDEKIVINNLTQRYGRKTALKQVSFSVGNGMYGLLGRNGAGKTTLMKTMTGLLAPKEGAIEICGVPVTRVRELRKLIGYLPQEFSLYPGMRVDEVLDYLAVLSDIPGDVRKKRIPELLVKVNLIDKRRSRVKSLSGGMKRRLGMAQALLHNPQVLIADEPTVGLDPEERVRLRELLKEEAKTKTVLLSTHIVEDIEALCEKAAILDEGRLIYHGSIMELMDKTGTTGIEEAYLKAIHSREVY